MRIHMHMTKVISLSDAAYSQMKTNKREGESFSDVVFRLIEMTGKKPFAEFFGRWPGDDALAIKKSITAERKKFKTREARF